MVTMMLMMFDDGNLNYNDDNANDNYDNVKFSGF